MIIKKQETRRKSLKRARNCLANGVLLQASSVLLCFLENQNHNEVREIIEFSKWNSIVIVLSVLNQNQDSFSARFFSIFASSSGEN